MKNFNVPSRVQSRNVFYCCAAVHRTNYTHLFGLDLYFSEKKCPAKQTRENKSCGQHERLQFGGHLGHKISKLKTYDSRAMGVVWVNSMWSIFKAISSEFVSLMWFEVPFCLAVPTRFLLRIKQQQQTRNIKGLSTMSLSIDGVSGEPGLTGSLIVFVSSLKHDDGIMYILRFSQLSLAQLGKVSRISLESRTALGRSVLLPFEWPIFSFPFTVRSRVPVEWPG